MPPRGRSSVDFGAYRETPRTVWRPRIARFAPAYVADETIHDAARAIERADHELVRLAPTKHGLLDRIRRASLARNAFATASIEGNPLTLPEVEELLRSEKPRARDADSLEILNYASFMTSPAAMRAPRTGDDVRAIHRALFRDIFRDAGRWKTRPNFIGRAADGTVVYVPTPPARVEPEIENALKWLHDAGEHPPLIRALLFHHEFESIHPFRDGNGRAGRAITPMALHAFGYRGVAYAEIDHEIYKRRASYYENLALIERNGFRDHTPWLAFMLDVVRTAYERAVDAARFERKLPANLPGRQRAIAEWFSALARNEPSARAKFHDVHQAFPAVAERTLKRDLAALRDAGVLDAEGRLKGTTYRLADAG